jgi:DNA polymerase II small subunit/DNA polymerase delta subunit B
MSKNMKMVRKTVEFEEIHGQGKIKDLSHKLEVEHAKVETLSGNKKKVQIEKTTSDNVIRFGLCGDTQFGNLHSAPELLHAYLKTCRAEGISTVLHTGDVLDGWKVYRGQEFDLVAVGLDKQLEIVERQPSVDGVEVKFITGNHDLSFKNLAGANIGSLIEKAREENGKDWVHLGDEQGRVKFVNKEGRSYEVMLMHPGGGTAYALSYKPQKLVESFEGGRKPNMLAIGHFHKSEFIPAYRNVAIVQTGCFEWQTEFMARMGLAAHVGGWLVEVTPGENYNRVRAEFIAFYTDK